MRKSGISVRQHLLRKWSEIERRNKVEGNKGRSGLRKRWEDEVKEIMEINGLKIKNAFDKLKCRRKVRTAELRLLGKGEKISIRKYILTTLTNNYC